MGLDGYVNLREKTKVQYEGNIGTSFREKMQEVIGENKNPTLVFTTDLKNMIHLADNSNDVNLVVEMVKKFNAQNKGIRFGVFVMGPVLMRLLHHLDLPDQVIEVLKAEEYDGFFDQITSYDIALDLLFKNERYQEVIDIFRILQEKRLQGAKFPNNCFTLTMASCYKLNTPESFEVAQNFIKEAQDFGTRINQKIITFIAHLAILQGYPHISVELVEMAQRSAQAAVRNLKAVALCHVNRVEDTMPIFRSLLQIDLPDDKRATWIGPICTETMGIVREAVHKTDDKELKSEFERIERNMQDARHISEGNIEDLLLRTIEYRPNKDKNDNRNRAMLAASFNRQNNYRRSYDNRQRHPSHQGLTDME